MTAKHYDLIVIGAGPGGYVGAIRAAQLGLRVACVDREAELGGVCLRVGCIPTKALLESSERYAQARAELAGHGVRVSGVELDLAAMQERKSGIVNALTKGVAFLFKKNEVTRYQGTGTVTGPGAVRVSGQDTIELTADRILIATGSTPATLPGVELDGTRIITSTESLEETSVPKRLIVIGAGVIGLELGSVWNRLGAEVTVVEYLDRILPGVDSQVARLAQRIFKRQGLRFQLGVKVQSARVVDDECVVELSEGGPLRADRVLVAVGRRPHTEGLGLESVGLELDAGGFIPVDERYATRVEGLYAVGDVCGGPMLAHKASHEAVACVEWFTEGWGHMNRDAIPNVVYTDPEVASVGRTEEQLVAAGAPFRAGTFYFKGNGRAAVLGRADGMVKVLAHADTDRVLGVHIFGPRAGDLISEAAAAMEFGASSEDLARVCHPHPSLSEAVMEAALAVTGRAIHG
ncbi:MAG: dihydrolipoyl dehydrogenase [bacterium]